jgi:hypothetical protein
MVQSINAREFLREFREELDEDGVDEHVHQTLHDVRVVQQGVDLLEQSLVLPIPEERREVR